ncbi:MAG TPA: hypothetical protein VGT99_13380 [Gammaproteobacteria bacterium]|nr:hypothetical protein [Gammaproteobacteria bacterium]
MPWSLEFTDGGRILKVLIQGRISSSEVSEITRESVAAVAKTQVTRIVLDCADAKMDVPILDVYKLPDLYSAQGLSHQVHAAVIMSREGYRREIYEFYEDVCRNRGYFVRLFEQEQDAWNWVRES